jgi:hypothetical protein
MLSHALGSSGFDFHIGVPVHFLSVLGVSHFNVVSRHFNGLAKICVTFNTRYVFHLVLFAFRIWLVLFSLENFCCLCIKYKHIGVQIKSLFNKNKHYIIDPLSIN